MSIPKETVEHVAKLARLELTEDEVARYSQDLSKILHLVEELDKLDLSQVEVGMAFENPTVFRPDEGQPLSFNRERLMEDAPSLEDHCFRVPKILEES